MILNNSVLLEAHDPLEFSDKLRPFKPVLQRRKGKQRIQELKQQVKALEAHNEQLQQMVQDLFRHYPELARQPFSPAMMRAGWSTPAYSGKLPAVSNSPAAAAAPPTLTRREIEVLDLLMQGMCAKEIASELSISETTVITHKKNLKTKFNVRNSVELISRAFNLPERYSLLS